MVRSIETKSLTGLIFLRFFTGSSNGRTTGFGPVYLGSSPSPVAVLQEIILLRRELLHIKKPLVRLFDM